MSSHVKKVESSSSSSRSKTVSPKSNSNRSFRSNAITTQVAGSAPAFSFPVSLEQPQLSFLTDNRSNDSSVARTCLLLNQSMHQHSENSICHDASYAKMVSSAIAALIECAQSHEDRRCRILTSKTLALVARAAYGRLRHTPLLFGVREQTLHRLEDEVGTDVPVALCTVALEDTDDGVAACAIEALGMLTLSPTQDDLLREMEGIAHARPSAYAPTIQTLADEDPSVPQLELQSRIYENVLSPRLWRLLQRIFSFSQQHQHRTLSFVTACLVHLVLASGTSSFGMDRSTYAKRWIEVDSAGMIHEVVNRMLLPALQQNNASLAHAASLCALRLAHVCPTAAWVTEACLWSTVVLMERVQSTNVLATVEDKLMSLAALVIALRVLPLPERTESLQVVLEHVQGLPSTTRVPAGVVSAGVLDRLNGTFRRPARVGLLTEVALSFFVDGPTNPDNPHGRSKAVQDFMSGHEVTALLSSRAGKPTKSRVNSINTSASQEGGARMSPVPSPVGAGKDFAGLHVAEELVLAFCQVASEVGRRVMIPVGQKRVSQGGLEEWLRSSLAMLLTFSPCLNWRLRSLSPSLEEPDHEPHSLFTVLAAAQAAYIRLLQECLYVVGLLSPTASVSLHLLPLALPPNRLLLEEAAEATVSLARFETISGCGFAHKDLTTLADQFLEYKIGEGIPSRHMRIALLAALTDHWVQSCHLAAAGPTPEQEDGMIYAQGSMSMNELNARELVAALADEISKLSTEIRQHQQERHGSPPTQADRAKRFATPQYLQVCVACVENLALTACDWSRRFGSTSQKNEAFRQDIDEDSNDIVQSALAALKGRNLRDEDVPDVDNDKGDTDDDEPMIPICYDAARRIVEASSTRKLMVDDAFGIGGRRPIVFSTLVIFAAGRARRAQGPRLSFGAVRFQDYTPEESGDNPESEILTGDAYDFAHLMHYSCQVISTRVDLSVLSSSLANVDASEYLPTRQSEGFSSVILERARQTNHLRLSIPPLPTSRLRKRLIDVGARLCWKESVSMVTGGSDPVAILLAHSIRRCPRYDCETAFDVFVTMRLTNTTAVEIAKGIRLGISATQRNPVSSASNTVTSFSAVYKQGIKAGDHVTWEVSLNDWTSGGAVTLFPSVAFRGIEKEQSSSQLSGETEDTNEATTSGGSQQEDLDKENALDEEEDVTLPCEHVVLSPMIMLHPCPLVFFRDDCGDESAFRFLWHHVPFRLQPIQLISSTPPSEPSTATVDEHGLAVSRLSRISLCHQRQEPFQQGWAFASLSGRRLLCVLSRRTSDKTGAPETPTLHCRADDEDLLRSLFSTSSKSKTIRSLTEGRWSCDDEAVHRVLVTV